MLGRVVGVGVVNDDLASFLRDIHFSINALDVLADVAHDLREQRRRGVDVPPVIDRMSDLSDLDGSAVDSLRLLSRGSVGGSLAEDEARLFGELTVVARQHLCRLGEEPPREDIALLSPGAHIGPLLGIECGEPAPVALAGRSVAALVGSLPAVQRENGAGDDACVALGDAGEDSLREGRNLRGGHALGAICQNLGGAQRLASLARQVL